MGAPVAWGAPHRPPEGAVMRVLLVDNHDSYTYNLAHLVAGVTGAAPAC